MYWEKVYVERCCSSFEKILGKKINVNIGERPYKDREVMFPIASYSQLPNWKVRVSLEEGLAKFGK